MRQYTFQIVMKEADRIIGTLTIEAVSLTSAQNQAEFVLDCREVKFSLLNVNPKS
jgi:hypothetical protein